jgi:hypothetical protein
MAEFGKKLRRFRQQCNDPKSPHGKLTQQRLGEVIGEEVGIRYSGAAVSDWERGITRIHADDRIVLICLVKVLHKYGGLKTLIESNELLESGNYRALNVDETKKLFPEGIVDISPQESSASSEKVESSQRIMDIVGKFSSKASEEFQAIVAKAKEGPSPYWPRVLAAFMRKASERWSVSITSIFWIAVWFIAWWLIAPSLRWPFADRNSASSAIFMYVTGTYIIPLLIGLLINTKHNEYWKQQSLTDATLLRLYTYQGAGIGFNLGYFFVFSLLLVRYYLQLDSSIWLEFAAVTAGLILGNMSARVVPHNLWVAYGRLRFADGAIFFVVALMGPLWGWFFLEFYALLLTPVLGIIVILVALIIVIVIAGQQLRKRAEQD